MTPKQLPLDLLKAKGYKITPHRRAVLQALAVCPPFITAQQICDELGIGLDEVCFVGDDINDVELLKAVGCPCCPPNARPEVKAIPNIHVLQTPGGQGAIREICDILLSY